MNNKEKRPSLEHWQVMAICLMICDVISVCLAYFLALWLRFDCIYSHIPQYFRVAFALFTFHMRWLRWESSGPFICTGECGAMPDTVSL